MKRKVEGVVNNVTETMVLDLEKGLKEG